MIWKIYIYALRLIFVLVKSVVTGSHMQVSEAVMLGVAYILVVMLGHVINILIKKMEHLSMI